MSAVQHERVSRSADSRSTAFVRMVMGPGEIFLRFDMDPPRSSVAASQRSCGSACGNVARGRSWPHRQPALGRLIGLRGLARFPSSPLASRWSAICGLMTTYRAAVGRVACRLDARPVGLQPGEVGQLVAHARDVAGSRPSCASHRRPRTQIHLRMIKPGSNSLRENPR